MRKTAILLYILLLCTVSGLFTGCGQSTAASPDSPQTQVLLPKPSPEADKVPVSGFQPSVSCPVPSADGITTYENEAAGIDASNISEGYICVRYLGSSSKVKLQITGEDGVTYTYNLAGNDYQVFPLSAGNGTYSIAVYENIIDNQYATVFSEQLTVQLDNEFGPYLYPNQYVNFTPDSLTVKKAIELARTADSELTLISNIYNYVTQSIQYDYNKAANITSGYTSNVDDTLLNGTGICLDYAAVMTSMLRCQGIPTRLEVGYAGEAYHAWISSYVKDIGWINSVIELKGNEWTLMDPTFAANSSEESLKTFIGDGNNYTVKYMY